MELLRHSSPVSGQFPSVPAADLTQTRTREKERDWRRVIDFRLTHRRRRKGPLDPIKGKPSEAFFFLFLFISYNFKPLFKSPRKSSRRLHPLSMFGGSDSSDGEADMFPRRSSGRGGGDAREQRDFHHRHHYRGETASGGGSDAGADIGGGERQRCVDRSTPTLGKERLCRIMCVSSRMPVNDDVFLACHCSPVALRFCYLTLGDGPHIPALIPQ